MDEEQLLVVAKDLVHRTFPSKLPIEHSWKVMLNRRTRSWGVCHYRERTITFSSKLFLALYAIDPDDAMDRLINCVRHEVAHAIAGHKAGHGSEWRETAIALGLKNPTRCAITAHDRALRINMAKYVATCDVPGHVHTRNTKAWRPRYCATSGYKLTYKRVR